MNRQEKPHNINMFKKVVHYWMNNYLTYNVIAILTSEKFDNIVTRRAMAA